MSQNPSPPPTVTSVVANARLRPFHYAVVSMCAVLMIIDGYDMVSYGTVIVNLMSEWNMDPVTAGTLGSTALVGMLLGGLFVAPLADKYGRRPLMITCVTVASIASFSCAFTTGPLQMGVLRVVVGISLGALVPNFTALVAEFSPQASKATLVTLVSSFYSVGGIAAALFAINVEPLWTWRGVFYVAGLPLLLVPILFRFLPESPEFLAVNGKQARLTAVLTKLAPDRDLRGVVATPRPAVQNARVVQLFTNGNVLTSALIWTFFAMCMLLSYGLNTWLPKLMQTAGYALESALWTLVMLNIGGMVGSVFGGWLSSRWSYRNTLVTYFTVAALSLIGLSFDPPSVLLNGLLFTAGATTIGTLAVAHAFAVEFYPTQVRSTGVGWAAGIGRIGAIAGPTLGGALLALQLPFQQNFLAVAMPGVVGAVAVAFVANRKFRERRAELTDAPRPTLHA